MILGAFDIETLSQLTANGLIAGASYGLLGVGFALILGVTGRFHFAYSITYTLAAYFIFTLWDWGLNLWLALIVGLVLISAVGAVTEHWVYRPIAVRAGGTALLAVFVAALGITIAGSNLIQLLWGSQNQNLYGPKQSTVIWGDARFLNFDLWSVSTAVALVALLSLLLRYTGLGRAIKATRVNPELASIIGISIKSVHIVVFAVGTLFAGFAAFFYALKFTIDPAMGLRPVIFAFVVAFLGGTASPPIRVFLTGVAISLIEQWSSIWLSVRWTQTAVFVILVVYLVFKAFDLRHPFARFKPAAAASA
jgi:branched-subunit amino acid ABC-type transport system permease component